jgi:hypothetical protein
LMSQWLIGIEIGTTRGFLPIVGNILDSANSQIPSLTSVRPQKSLKIDLNTEYPCPCRRHGRLLPITLTEAFGCDRCQQIFVLENDGKTIEQLSSSYPYKRAWRWTGYRWMAVHSGLGENYLPMALGLILILLVIWLPLALRSPSSLGIIFWVAIAVVFIILPVFAIWLVYLR